MALKQMEPKVEKIGEMKFYITPFPAFKAANLTGELASVLAPILGALASLIPAGTGGDGEGNDLMDIDVGEAARAISSCSAMDGDKLERLMKKLLVGGNIVVEAPDENGDVEAQRLDMDLANELFCGEVQDMFILCFYVIRLNFNGFFKRLAGLSGNAGTAQAAPRKIL